MARIRRTNGRRKIEFKKISKESNLHVTFSKRRNGIFKKASELCTLCLAEMAVIVFSPGNKVFTFGHHSVKDVIDRLRNGAPPQTSSVMQVIEALRNANMRNLNAQLTQFTDGLEMERKRSAELNKLLRLQTEQFWFASPIDEMNKPQLEYLLSALGDLKNNLNYQENMIRMAGSNQPQFYAGSSSGLVAPKHESEPLVQSPVMQGNPVLKGNMIPQPFASQGFFNRGGFGSGFH